MEFLKFKTLLLVIDYLSITIISYMSFQIQYARLQTELDVKIFFLVILAFWEEAFVKVSLNV